MIPVALSGIGLALPGVEALADLAGPAVAGSPVEPAQRLGKRGLRYKDRATQLALCAARDALTEAGLLGEDGLTVPGESVAVVASSNLGSVDTVSRVATTIAGSGVPGTSPMDLPNASSNVVASSVAIRFGLRGPNVMVCNGATSGLDAVHWAATLIAAGRVQRALVIGVEPANEDVARFTGTDQADLLDGAAALVLTAGDTGSAGTGVRLGGYVRTGDLSGCVERCVERLSDKEKLPFDAWYVPERYAGQAPVAALAEVPRHDLTERFGRSSGALGVLQCAAAAGALRSGGTGPVLVTAGDNGDDGCAGLVLLP